MALPSLRRVDEAIAKIEVVIEGIADCIERQEPIFIPLRHKPKRSARPHKVDESSAPIKYTNVSWPGHTAQEARRFTVLLRILELMHEALVDDKIVSKRNIYYQDPALFKTQNVVDKYVDTLAFTFGLQRAELHIAAAAKGLIAGSILIATHPDGSMSSHGLDGSPHLVVDSYHIQGAGAIDAAWILVVEKESTFRTLVAKMVHCGGSAGHGVIITGKGQGDLSTRKLVHHLSNPGDHLIPYAVTRPPVYMLADFDPYGIEIMSVYKHGSHRLAHEYGLMAGRMQWLGIKSADIDSNIMSSTVSDDKGLMKLTVNDRKKAAKMLWRNRDCPEDDAGWQNEERRETDEGDGPWDPEWRRELQVMLMLGVKAEMEILGQGDVDIGDWVAEHLTESAKGGSMEGLHRKTPEVRAE